MISLKQRHTVRLSLASLWLLLYLWNTLIYIFPALFNRISEAQTWVLSGLLAVIMLFSELRGGRRVSTRFVVVLLGTVAVIVFFALRQFGAGLYMLPVYSLLFLYEFRYVSWQRREERTMCVFCALIYVSMLYQTYRVYRGDWTRTTSYSKNTIAEMLFLCTALIFLFLYQNRDLRVRLLLAGMFVLTAVGILNLHCRAALICLVLFLLFHLFRLARKRPGVLFGLAVVLCVAGTLMPVLYISLFNEVGLGWLNVLGKDLFTGREYIWRLNFSALTSSPMTLLFGTPRQFHYAIDNNLHNLYLFILVRGGLVGMAAYWSIFLAAFRKCTLGLDPTGASHGYAYLALSILLYGFFEVSYLWNIFLPFGLLPFLVLSARANTYGKE